MSDLHDRFRGLDRVRPPDLWSEVIERARHAPTNPPWSEPMSRFLPVAVVATGLVLVLVSIGLLVRPANLGPPSMPTTSSTPRASATSALQGQVVNGWVAFSSQPGDNQVPLTDFRVGGDIYLTRLGREPRMIVSRGPTEDRNVCPTFSPDGSRLAYGTWRADSDPAVVLLDVAADGSTAEAGRYPVPGVGAAPCPRWSPDATELYFVSRMRVLVLGLDGSITDAGEGGPSRTELEPLASDGPFQSPSGELTVTRNDTGEIVVAEIGGGQPRVLLEDSSSGTAYAIAGWSPDSAWVLVMYDVDGMHFSISALPVDARSDGVEVADSILINGARSWPLMGDVSWQALVR